jgi:hypothetical protein
LSTPPTGATTLTTAGSVTVILTDVCDWQAPVRDAARLAAASGRKLRVVLADSDELLAAASLDCVRLLASGGLVSAFDPAEARRLVRAQTARLRQELQTLAKRLAIDTELVETRAATEPSLWAGSTALTVFGRRRRGLIMVVHAGTTGTLEVAARLAAERRQAVRLLVAGAAADPALLHRLFGPWLTEAPESLGESPALPRPPANAGAIAAMVIDPAWLEQRRLSLQALVEQWLKLRAAEPD